MKLLSVEADPKTSKSSNFGYLVGILYLAPHTEVNFGSVNMCPKASPQCADDCLFHNGLAGVFPKIKEARINKTLMYIQDQANFLNVLKEDIDGLIRQAERRSLKPAVRLNGTSDIVWERKHPNILEYCAERGVQTYDYTKIPGRKPLYNYHLTFSRSELNEAECRAELARGLNISVVFRKLPATLWNHPVVDGDTNDLRFLDPPKSIIGLKAKGTARKNTGGFVL